MRKVLLSSGIFMILASLVFVPYYLSSLHNENVRFSAFFMWGAVGTFLLLVGVPVMLYWIIVGFPKRHKGLRHNI